MLIPSHAAAAMPSSAIPVDGRVVAMLATFGTWNSEGVSPTIKRRPRARPSSQDLDEAKKGGQLRLDKLHGFCCEVRMRMHAASEHFGSTKA